MELENKNPFPEIRILPSVRDIARFVGRLLTPHPSDAPPFMSNHYRGAAEMLDQHLYEPSADQLSIPFGDAKEVEG